MSPTTDAHDSALRPQRGDEQPQGQRRFNVTSPSPKVKAENNAAQDAEFWPPKKLVADTSRTESRLRRMLSVRRWFLFFTIAITPTAVLEGQTIVAFETYSVADPPPCATPPSNSLFASTDATVKAWVFLAGLHTGDRVQVHFFPPGASTYRFYWYWNPTPSDGNWCFWADVGISQWIAPNWGGWRAQLSLNGTDIGQPITFEVSAPSTTISVTWANGGRPPTSLASGQPVALTWIVTGPASVESRICWGTDSNPQNCPQQTAWQTGNGQHSVGLLAPSVDLATYYFIVQAHDTGTGLDYWSSPTQSLVSGTIITSTNQWLYNADAYGTPQNGWWARLVKTPVSGNRYKYTLSVLLSGGGTIQDASVAVITDLRIGMVRGSYLTQVTRSLFPVPSANLQWEGPPNFNRADSLSNLAFDLWGFLNPEVGLAFGVKGVLDDLQALSQANISPSPWLADKMLDENNYRVSRMGYAPDNGLFSGLLPSSGVSFSVTVDENSGLQPEFFMRTQTKLGTVIGVEIGLDRKAIVNVANYNPF